jgi:hypothetical protein
MSNPILLSIHTYTGAIIQKSGAIIQPGQPIPTKPRPNLPGQPGTPGFTSFTAIQNAAREQNKALQAGQSGLSWAQANPLLASVGLKPANVPSAQLPGIAAEAALFPMEQLYIELSHQ